MWRISDISPRLGQGIWHFSDWLADGSSPGPKELGESVNYADLKTKIKTIRFRVSTTIKIDRNFERFVVFFYRLLRIDSLNDRIDTKRTVCHTFLISLTPRQSTLSVVHARDPSAADRTQRRSSSHRKFFRP